MPGLMHCAWACAALAASLILAEQAYAAGETVLHSFCAESNCGDGYDPVGGLVMDASGTLYGTADGGKNGYGLVFKLVPNSDRSQYKEYILHNFCSRSDCSDGQIPQGDLVLDKSGNLYGTTAQGGTHNAGVVFKLSHVANGWSYGVIHDFCSETDCTDAAFPSYGLSYAEQASGVPWDESSPLFGPAEFGGAHNHGAVYELAPDGAGAWTFQVVHSFNPAGVQVSSVAPGPLLVASSGDLYGATRFGGKYDGGMLYRLSAGSWGEATLHNFCAGANCSDGSTAYGRLLMNGAGNLFGITYSGGLGATCRQTEGCGVVFERTAAGHYSVVYNFCSLGKCKDGFHPFAGLVADAFGNYIGTASEGGINKAGTAFLLIHGSTGWSATVLYSFCSLANCVDGNRPAAAPVIDADGNLFRTTTEGGAHSNGGILGGTVFELKP